MRISEVYTSVQGEGPNTADPTTFLRFGGCNLRCPGWGMGTLPDGTPVPGCDTTFAVYPQWSKTWDREQVDAVMERVPESPQRVCLTGGEPLIQPRLELLDLYERLVERGHVIDLFTNGTQELPGWAMSQYVTVIMDWKLPGSGEGESFNLANLPRLGAKDAVKFVCKHRADFDIALRRAKVVEEQSDAQRWFGVVWGEMSEGTMAEYVAAEYPSGKVNIQTHKFLWDPDERRR